MCQEARSTCRLSLGIPSSLLMSGLELATRCTRESVTEAGAGARVVMEAGYILLGALCIALPQDVMEVTVLDQSCPKAAIVLGDLPYCMQASWPTDFAST